MRSRKNNLKSLPPITYQIEKRGLPLRNSFWSSVLLDKLKGQFAKQKVTSLPIFTAIIIALLATSTTALANHSIRDDDGPAQTTPPPNQTSPRRTTALYQTYMQDKTHGWTLAVDSVLKTSDGGQHWTDVTPPTSAITQKKVMWLVGTFLNQNVGWVVGQAEESATIFTQHTTDGGSHWQSSLLSGDFEVTAEVIGPPHFINMQEGWLDVMASFAFSGDNAISRNKLFHTTDGGLHWNIVATSEQIHQSAAPFFGIDTGISVKDAHNFWETVNPRKNQVTGAIPDFPMVFVSHDGAKTWQQQKLPTILGLANVHYTTTPPKFFGNYGLMSVKVTPTSSTEFSIYTASSHSHLSIYVTNDGGAHWSSNGQTPFEIEDGYIDSGETEQVDILDRQHIWIESPDGIIHASQDGGKSWKTQAPIGGNPVPILRGITFIDPNTGWMTTWSQVTDPDGTSHLLQTTDGGHTWQPINYSVQ